MSFYFAGAFRPGSSGLPGERAAGKRRFFPGGYNLGLIVLPGGELGLPGNDLFPGYGRVPAGAAPGFVFPC